MNKNKKTRSNAESDLLVFNATLPNHYAFGTETDGTIFIQNVCKVFDEAYKGLPDNIPLSQMILNINTRVRDSGIQLADPINHLMADVYFMPKNVSFTWNIDIYFRDAACERLTLKYRFFQLLMTLRAISGLF